MLPLIEVVFPSSDKIKRKTLTYTELLRFTKCGFKNWEHIIIDILLSRIDADESELVNEFIIK